MHLRFAVLLFLLTSEHERKEAPGGTNGDSL